MFEYWMETELTRLPTVRQYGYKFSQDENANKIGAVVYKDGEPVTLAGDVFANIIKPNGVTITVSGSKEGNKAWVVLPASAYTHVGRIRIVLKLTSDSKPWTLGAVEGFVYRSMTSEVVGGV